MQKTDWFNEARYGMFIHWGAYAVAGRGEWVRNRERIPQDEYQRLYAENFRAEKYDPLEWAALAKDAGMRYAVLTARHHDGFSLWPTKTNDFHAGNIGPKRDLVGPFVEAFRSAGLKVGLYYSPADWASVDYPGAYFRDWPAENDWENDKARERFIAYYKEQVRELMTNYGKIDYLWYDGCIPANLQCSSINEEALKLQPELLINERNGPPWHIKICEQAIKPAPPGTLWEACMTLNGNWGWHAGDTQWKMPLQVLQMLLETSAGGGNLLLNVGPKPDGTIPEESARILREAGGWLKKNADAVYGTSRSPFTWNNWGRVTSKGNWIYLNIWNYPSDMLCFAELKTKVKSVKVLGSNKSLPFEQQDERLFIGGLDSLAWDVLVNTIVVECDGVPSTITEQTSFWIPG